MGKQKPMKGKKHPKRKLNERKYKNKFERKMLNKKERLQGRKTEANK